MRASSAAAEPDAVDVARVLVLVQPRAQPDGPGARVERLGRRAEDAPVDEEHVVVGLAGIGDRRRLGRSARGRARARRSPCRASQPGWPTSRAPSRTTCATWSDVSVGRCARTQATAAETIGAEKLRARQRSVAVGRRRPSSSAGERHAGDDADARRAQVDGGVRLEKKAAWSGLSVAATVRTCGSEAGNSFGLPCVVLVAGRGDGDRAGGDGLLELDVLGEAERVGAVAHVDHGGAGRGGGGDPARGVGAVMVAGSGS